MSIHPSPMEAQLIKGLVEVRRHLISTSCVQDPGLVAKVKVPCIPALTLTCCVILSHQFFLICKMRITAFTSYTQREKERRGEEREVMSSVFGGLHLSNAYKRSLDQPVSHLLSKHFLSLFTSGAPQSWRTV